MTVLFPISPLDSAGDTWQGDVVEDKKTPKVGFVFVLWVRDLSAWGEPTAGEWTSTPTACFAFHELLEKSPLWDQTRVLPMKTLTFGQQHGGVCFITASSNTCLWHFPVNPSGGKGILRHVALNQVLTNQRRSGFSQVLIAMTVDMDFFSHRFLWEEFFHLVVSKTAKQIKHF